MMIISVTIQNDNVFVCDIVNSVFVATTCLLPTAFVLDWMFLILF